MFFSDQQEIIDNCVVGIWTLQMSFTHFIKNSHGSQLPLHAPDANLNNLLHPQQRDIYVEPRMTKATYVAIGNGSV